MSEKLSSKVALITGSSRGIGRAVALAFAREGAAFIGVHYASNADAARATTREIEALGSKAVAIKADLSRGKEATKPSAMRSRQVTRNPPCNSLERVRRVPWFRTTPTKDA